jgi:hypothetical protein
LSAPVSLIWSWLHLQTTEHDSQNLYIQLMD